MSDDTWWRDYQLQAVVGGAAYDFLTGVLELGLVPVHGDLSGAGDSQDELAGRFREFATEFARLDAGADCDAMTRLAERGHNRKTAIRAMRTCLERWGKLGRESEFTEIYDRRDSVYNSHIELEHEPPKGR